MEADREQGGVQWLGIPEMDADHQELLGMALQLSEGLRGGLPTFAVLERLDDLLTLNLRHFDREENPMAEESYSHLHEQLHSHNCLLRARQDFREDVRGQRYRTELAVKFIHAWIVEHVRIEDTRYAGPLRMRSAATAGGG